MSEVALVEVEPGVRSISNGRALAPWYAAAFLNSYAATLLTSCSYWYAEKALGASNSQRLWLSAGWGLAYVFISLLAGKLSERLGARRMVLGMIAGCIGTATLGLGAVAWPSLWTLAAAMLAYNLTSSQIWPALESAITRSPGTVRLSSRVALYNITWAAAGTMAFLTGGSVAKLGWAWIFLTPAIASLAATIVLLSAAIPERMLQKEHSHEGEDSDEGDGARDRVKRPEMLLYMAWVGNALAYMAIQTLIPVIPTLTKMAGITDMGVATALAAVWTFSRFAGFFATWRWTRWHYSVRWLLVFQALIAVTFCALLVIPSLPLPQEFRVALFVLAQVVFGISLSFVYASSLYYAMHVSAGSGGHAGIHEALIGVGIAFGPTVGAVAGTGSGESIGRIVIAVTALLAVGTAVMTCMGRLARQGK